MTDMSAFNVKASSGGPAEFLMKGDNGLELREMDRDEFGEPQLGWQPKLQLVGIAKPWETDDNYAKLNPDGTKPKQLVTRFLIRVVNRDADDHGTMLATMYPMNGISSRSVSGEILGAIRGKPLADGEAIDWNDYIGVGYFAAMLTDKGKDGKQVTTRVLKGSCQPVKSTAKPKADKQPNPFDDEEAA